MLLENFVSKHFRFQCSLTDVENILQLLDLRFFTDSILHKNYFLELKFSIFLSTSCSIIPLLQCLRIPWFLWILQILQILHRFNSRQRSFPEIEIFLSTSCSTIPPLLQCLRMLRHRFQKQKHVFQWHAGERQILVNMFRSKPTFQNRFVIPKSTCKRCSKQRQQQQPSSK